MDKYRLVINFGQQILSDKEKQQLINTGKLDSQQYLPIVGTKVKGDPVLSKLMYYETNVK